MAKFTRKDKQERIEKAKKELERQVLMEAAARGNFHRALRCWLELIAPNPVDVTELERMHALQEPHTDSRD